MKGYEKMKLNNGTLELNQVNFEHIQGRMDNAEMTLQEAFEQELDEHNIQLKNVYEVQMNMGIDKKFIELYCRIACEVKTGRSK